VIVMHCSFMEIADWVIFWNVFSMTITHCLWEFSHQNRSFVLLHLSLVNSKNAFFCYFFGWILRLSVLAFMFIMPY
jgi:hypothetical protein